ncbi:response regulator transcription factor [Paenibacillus algicola]|nr:response regulator transcription factor [Paenibacillus algicola]
MMSHTATLTKEQQGSLLDLLQEEVPKAPNHSCGLLFLHCAGGMSGTPGYVEAFIQSIPGAGRVYRDRESGIVALLLPGLTLSAAHYQALLLKQHLLRIKPDADPRMALTALTDIPAVHMLNSMAESVRLSITSDIQIFTEHSPSGASKILIVDHDDAVREFLQIRLELQGYHTLEAHDGLKALELIPQWKPDLVLTELNLSGIDGLPFIHHIHQLEVDAPPKIVILTEKRVEQTISQCFQHGVDDYVTKPFSPIELDARIRRCLH